MERQEHRSFQWSWDLLLWTVLLLMMVPLVFALTSLPWSRHLPVGVVLVIALIGTAIGYFLSHFPLRSRWWWASLIAAPAIGAAVSLGAVIASHANRGGPAPAGTVLVGAYIAALTTSLPWLAFRTRQVWLCVALIWVTLVGAWGLKLSAQQIWLLIMILVLSLLFLGLCHLREEVRLWDDSKLQRLGPVLWPSARAILLLSLLVALVGLIPLSSAQLAALNQIWRRSLIAKSGPLTYVAPNGTPVAVLGAPLALNAPNVGGNEIILSYEILSAPQTTPLAALPPLLGTTLDSFDGQTWQQSAQTTTVPLAKSLALPSTAQLLKASITVDSLPKTGQGSFLIGFDQPIGFSVPVRAAVVGTSNPDILGIASWQTTANLAKATSYTENSAILPDDVTETGTLPPALAQQMTATPDNLTAELRATARAWVGSNATSPTEQAHALLSSFQKQMTLDPSAQAPAGVNPVEWSLQNRRGNVLLWTTDYILLGRSIGLPMRLAEGYLPGSYDAKLNTTVVRASDATVWAQLAVPGSGWLDLFPASTTVSVQVPSKIIYQSAPLPTPTPVITPRATKSALRPNPASQSPSGIPASGFLILALIGVGIVLLVIILGLVAALLSWRWSRFGYELPPLVRFFARLRVLASLAGIRLRPSDTATQATIKVTAYVPDQAGTLLSLNGMYERMRYAAPVAQQGIGSLLTGLQNYWQHLQSALVRLIVTRPWRHSHERSQ